MIPVYDIKTDDPSGEWAADDGWSLQVGLRGGRIELWVQAAVPDDTEDVWFMPTPAQAREIAAALLKLADEVEGVGS